MFKAYDKEQNITFTGETTPRHDGKTLSVIVSSNTDISPLQNAERIDVYLPGSEEKVSESYRVVCWKSMERLWDGIRLTWQTYAPDELETMQENLSEMQKALESSKEALKKSEARVELLTKALLDLAGVVGSKEEKTDDGVQEIPENSETEENPATELPVEKPRRRRKKEATEDA